MTGAELKTMQITSVADEMDAIRAVLAGEIQPKAGFFFVADASPEAMAAKMAVQIERLRSYIAASDAQWDADAKTYN